MQWQHILAFMKTEVIHCEIWETNFLDVTGALSHVEHTQAFPPVFIENHKEKTAHQKKRNSRSYKEAPQKNRPLRLAPVERNSEIQLEIEEASLSVARDKQEQ